MFSTTAPTPELAPGSVTGVTLVFPVSSALLHSRPQASIVKEFRDDGRFVFNHRLRAGFESQNWSDGPGWSIRVDFSD